MQPPLSRLLESQQVQVQAATAAASITAISTSLKAVIAQGKREGSSPSQVALSMAGQILSPSLRIVPLEQKPTPEIVHGVPECGLPKPPIIIQDSDSDNDGEGVGRQNLPVPVPPVSHLAVPPEPAKSMRSQSINKSVQIIDLTSIDDEEPNLIKQPSIANDSHFNQASSSARNPSVLSPTGGQHKPASNSGLFSSQTPSTKLQTPLARGLGRTGTGASVQDAIDLDAGSDLEENNSNSGDEIVDITAEQYEAAVQASQSHSRPGRVKGKTMKGSTSIPTPIPEPMKAKVKVSNTNGMNADNPTPSSSIQPSSQTKRSQLNASHLSSTTTSTPKRTVGEHYHT